MWPDVRDAEELHDILATFIALPDLSKMHAASESRDPDEADDSFYLQDAVRKLLESCAQYFDELLQNLRAGRAEFQGRTYWVTAEKAKAFLTIFPSAQFVTPMAELDSPNSSRADALQALVAGWLDHAGPVRATALSGLLGISLDDVNGALLGLESQGAILRGHFSGHPRMKSNGATAAFSPKSIA